MDDIKPLSVAGYFVTRDGVILSQRRRGGSAFVGGDYHAVSAFLYRGRPRIRLFNGGRIKTAWVDELVAEAFHHGRSPFRPLHLDGDPTNCRADNLLCRAAVLIKADSPPQTPVDADGYTPPRSWRERSNAMADRKAEVMAAIASASKDETPPPQPPPQPQPPPPPPPPQQTEAEPKTPMPTSASPKLNTADRKAEMEERKRLLSSMIAKIGGCP